jgi:hypothetical protein
VDALTAADGLQRQTGRGGARRPRRRGGGPARRRRAEEQGGAGRQTETALSLRRGPATIAPWSLDKMRKLGAGGSLAAPVSRPAISAAVSRPRRVGDVERLRPRRVGDVERLRPRRVGDVERLRPRRVGRGRGAPGPGGPGGPGGCLAGGCPVDCQHTGPGDCGLVRGRCLVPEDALLLSPDAADPRCSWWPG